MRQSERRMNGNPAGQRSETMAKAKAKALSVPSPRWNFLWELSMSTTGLALWIIATASEVAFFYFTISRAEWFWLAVGFVIWPVGPIYGLINLISWMIG